MAPGKPRFYSAITTAAGDRAALTWNRRAAAALTNSIPQNWLTTTYAQTDLDLSERTAGSCAPRTSSMSALDNVEQTRSPGAAAVTYVVRAAGDAIDAGVDEPYALAATRSLSPLSTPSPELRVSIEPSVIQPGGSATLTVTASTPSTDMDAAELEVAARAQAGLEVIDGAPSKSAATFPARAQRTFSWTVRALSGGEHTVSVHAHTTACGETTTCEGVAALTVSAPAEGVSHAPAAAPGSTATPATGVPIRTAAAKRVSRVRIRTLIRSQRSARVIVGCTLTRGAPGRVRVTFRLRRGPKRKTLTVLAAPRSGRWRVSARVPAHHRRFTVADVTARYTGGAAYRASRAQQRFQMRYRR